MSTIAQAPSGLTPRPDAPVLPSARAGCRRAASVLRGRCAGVAPVLLRYCERVGPLPILCTTLVHPLSIPYTWLLLRRGLRSPYAVSTEPRLGLGSIRLAAIQRKSPFDFCWSFPATFVMLLAGL